MPDEVQFAKADYGHGTFVVQVHLRSGSVEYFDDAEWWLTDALFVQVIRTEEVVLFPTELVAKVIVPNLPIPVPKPE